ncbi:MAG: thioredoxin [Actinomycetota bacterium]|nr:thioredoxin [Actinomycetota bacterium]
MATLELTTDNFEQTVAENDIVLVDFWAQWCGPCRNFAPVFEKAAGTHADLVFAKVDTEAQQELAGMFGIQSIPTLAIFREQIVVFMQPGALPETVLEDLIGQVRGLDMNEVRQSIQDHDHGPDCDHDHAHDH